MMQEKAADAKVCNEGQCCPYQTAASTRFWDRLGCRATAYMGRKAPSTPDPRSTFQSIKGWIAAVAGRKVVSQVGAAASSWKSSDG